MPDLPPAHARGGVGSDRTTQEGSALKAASVLILIVGLSIAATIYVFAPDTDENLAMEEIALSKQYVRTLRQFGGRQAVLFDEFQSWFGSLWRGKQLGVTIGWISVGAALVLYSIARRDK